MSDKPSNFSPNIIILEYIYFLHDIFHQNEYHINILNISIFGRTTYTIMQNAAVSRVGSIVVDRDVHYLNPSIATWCAMSSVIRAAFMHHATPLGVY